MLYVETEDPNYSETFGLLVGKRLFAGRNCISRLKPSIKSDHSAITLSINGIDDSKHGPSFWKFNFSLVNDNIYCDLLDTNIKSWLKEFKDVVDKCVLWGLLKYKIRQLTVSYSKTKAWNRKAKLNKLEEKLQNCAKRCDDDPSRQNLEDLECLQAEYDQLYDYVTKELLFVRMERGTKKVKRTNIF